MIDFTSSLYLGMKHSSAELPGWKQLTSGAPSALYEFEQSKQITAKVALMQGLSSGITSPSTLHLYWDLYGFLGTKRIVVFIDEKIYPVSKYGIERLIVKKIPVRSFRHFDIFHLGQLIKSCLPTNSIPVILTDGWCPQCGKPAPVKDYLEILRPFGGKTILDDSQSFGILGKRINNTCPYGKGGGGILKWLNLQDPNVVTINSLAKGFGVPMAVMSGSVDFIQTFKKYSETRIHSSPVSAAHLNAALNALMINDSLGDQKRNRLWKNVLLFRNELTGFGVSANGGIFPVQNINQSNGEKITALHEKLIAYGVRTALTSPHLEPHPVISVIVRSDHSENDLRRLGCYLKKSCQRMF
ncbi:aminotransferase class I/II-fold pyridoxal phosphate-dependent enzyme [Flavitalea antarctica]